MGKLWVRWTRPLPPHSSFDAPMRLVRKPQRSVEPHKRCQSQCKGPGHVDSEWHHWMALKFPHPPLWGGGAGAWPGRAMVDPTVGVAHPPPTAQHAIAVWPSRAMVGAVVGVPPPPFCSARHRCRPQPGPARHSHRSRRSA